VQVASWAQLFGTSFNLFFTLLQWTLRPNPAGSEAAPHLPFLVGGFVLFALGSSVWLAQSYRLPQEA
jgi:hypothetical protein